MGKLVRDMVRTMKRASEAKTKPSDDIAVVQRIEGDTAWVHIPGGVDETPVQMTINCREGETVRVRRAGGQAWVVGNATAPPTDDSKAIEVEEKTKNLGGQVTRVYKGVDQLNTLIRESVDGIEVGKVDESGQYTTGHTLIDAAENAYKVIDADGNVVASFGATSMVGEMSNFATEITANETKYYKNNLWVGTLGYDSEHGFNIRDKNTNLQLSLGDTLAGLMTDQGFGVQLNGSETIIDEDLTVLGAITAGGHPSGLLTEEVVLADNLTVTHASYANSSKSVAKTGYTPIGIVGMHTENATSGGTYNTWVTLHSFYLSGSTAYFIVRNTHASTDAKIKITATILYAKS